MKLGAKKAPEWESELWSFVNRGDGEHCPLYGDDTVGHCSKCCIKDTKEMFSGLHGTRVVGSNSDENELNVSRNLFEHKFIPNWVPGRIFQLIEILANKYIKQAKLTQPPVITDLIKQFDISPGIEIRPLSLKAYHGAVWHLKDGWVIHLNNGDKPARQRVTLFHEIFHVLAHYRASPVFRKRGLKEGVFNEMLADYFASCILMPREWVKEKWAEVNNLKQMTKNFQVTEVSMWIRLKTMGLI